jgi:hypothetical protein
MVTVVALIKRNQRQLELNRRSISHMWAGRCRVSQGGRDITKQTVGLLTASNKNLREANRILRQSGKR